MSAGHFEAPELNLGSEARPDKVPLRQLVPLPSIKETEAACMPSFSGRSDWAALDSMERHPSVAALRKQERTLRALLDKANQFGHSHAPTSLPRLVATPPSSSPAARLYDPDVTRLKDQLLKCCAMQRPGEDGGGCLVIERSGRRMVGGG